jgi:hypothetical protein
MGSAMQNAFPTIVLYVAIVAGLIVIGLTVVGGIAFWRTEKGSARTFSLLFERANVIQMLAVLLIILAATGLRIMDKIGAEALVSLLSGIAGYVLGGVSRSQRSTREEEPQSN